MLKKIKQWFGGAKRPQRLAMLCMALVMAMSVGITAAWAAGGGIATATSTSTSDSPVFVNDSVPGSLTIKKNVDWSEYDEDTDFEFKVVLNAPDGEAIEGNWSYKSDEKPEMVAFAVYSEDDNSLDFYKRAKTSVPKVGATFNGKTVTRLYKNIENQTGTSYYSVPWFSESFTTGRSGISSVCVVDAGIQPTNCAGWFYGMSKMTSCDIELLDTGNVTNMSYMFQYCSSLTSLDLGDSFDTGNVTTMRGMFDGCNKLTLDCSSWNVDKVTDYSAFNSSAPDVIAPTWVNG